MSSYTDLCRKWLAEQDARGRIGLDGQLEPPRARRGGTPFWLAALEHTERCREYRRHGLTPPRELLSLAPNPFRPPPGFDPAPTPSAPPPIAASHPRARTAQPKAAPAERRPLGRVAITGQINGRTVQHLAKQLEAVREHGARGLFVTINSCGGFVHESMVTHLMLRHFAKETGGPIVSWVGGAGAVAESGASVVMLAGDLVYLHSQSSVMIHQPSGGDDIGRAAAFSRVVEFYTTHTMMSEPECSGSDTALRPSATSTPMIG